MSALCPTERNATSLLPRSIDVTEGKRVNARPRSEHSQRCSACSGRLQLLPLLLNEAFLFLRHPGIVQDMPMLSCHFPSVWSQSAKGEGGDDEGGVDEGGGQRPSLSLSYYRIMGCHS